MNVLNPQMLIEWLDNMAINSRHTLRDISQWRPQKKDIKKIVIGGSGPTGYKLRGKIPAFENTLLVSNQSTMTQYVDVVVVTDSGLAVIDKLDRLGPEITVFAATIAPPWIWRTFPETYAFIHDINDGGDPMLSLVNRMMQETAPELGTHVIQAGMSLNAALIITLNFIEHGVLPKVPIYLVGMDCAYESTIRKRSDGYAEGGNVICDHKGRLTSKALLDYAGDMRKIVEGFAGVTEIYAEPNKNGLLGDFMEERSAFDE